MMLFKSVQAKIEKTFWQRIRDFIRPNLLAGILFLAPVVATFVVLRIAISWMDRVFLLIPPAFRPENILPFDIPGLGVLALFILLVLTGFLVRNYLGKKVVATWDYFISHIPLVSKFYKSVKQLVETVAHSGKDFKRVVLIQFPRKGIYSLAYVTGIAVGELQEKTQKKVLNVYVPTTPNPTSGYYLIVPEDEVITLDMSVEDSFKLLVSGGIINPQTDSKF